MLIFNKTASALTVVKRYREGNLHSFTYMRENFRKGAMPMSFYLYSSNFFTFHFSLFTFIYTFALRIRQ